MASAWACRSVARSVVTQVGVADPQVAQQMALALAVAGVAGDGQRLGVQVDRPLGNAAQAAVDDPKVAQQMALALAVAGVAGDGQRLGVQVGRPLVLTQVEWQDPRLASR